MSNKTLTFFMFTALLFMLKSHAQVPVPDCAVLTAALSKKYEGECKKGQASGKGEAWGDSHHYTGEFKKGMPNGKGTYHFNADSLYTGNIQDGLREGKGEMTYKKSKNGVVHDSIVQGYWSGDIYRGKSYRTFAMSGGSNFSSYDISPSASSGDMLTFEIASTSGNPARGEGIYVSSLSAQYPGNKNFSKIISSYDSANTSFTNVQIGGFPAKIKGRLTDGTNFELELYKPANWKIRLFVNK